MNETSLIGGLSGVVVTLAGVISYLAIHIRDQNKNIEDIRKDQVAKAETHSKEKDKIYLQWMASDNAVRSECKKEMKDLLDKDQALVLSTTEALRDLLRERGNVGE